MQSRELGGVMSCPQQAVQVRGGAGGRPLQRSAQNVEIVVASGTEAARLWLQPLLKLCFQWLCEFAASTCSILIVRSICFDLDRHKLRDLDGGLRKFWRQRSVRVVWGGFCNKWPTTWQTETKRMSESIGRQAQLSKKDRHNCRHLLPSLSRAHLPRSHACCLS